MATTVVGPVYVALLSLWNAVVLFLPDLIAATLLLIVGFVVGKVVGTAIKEVLMRANIDKHVKIKQEELRLSNVFSELVKWVLYLMFISQAASTIGVTLVARAIGGLVTFLPNVLASIIIVAAGYVIARYVEDMVAESRFSYSGLMSKVFFFFVVYVSIAIGLNALNTNLPSPIINAGLINNILLIIVGSAGLGFAIALGLGMKDMIRDVTVPLGKDVVKSVRRAESRSKKR